MALFNLNLTKKKLDASWEKHVLKFKKPAGTSRGTLLNKDCYLLKIKFLDSLNTIGIGECSPLWGLSIDDQNSYESTLNELCRNINNYPEYLDKKLNDFPSILFGLEMALKSLEQNGSNILFPSNFTKGLDFIKINGLIWMGSPDEMLLQIHQKINLGFTCIKLKIGAIDFKKELELLKLIRKEFNEQSLEIRVDANGAFAINEALNKLEKLAELNIHSIEQPIKAGNWTKMAELCKLTPLPIALDEELIGQNQIIELLEKIKPQYLIFKPSLLGGFKKTEQWILAAKNQNIPWWITSALESNVGLNAIAQFTYLTNNQLPQGLGTGSLFENNIGIPNKLKGEKFYFE